METARATWTLGLQDDLCKGTEFAEYDDSGARGLDFNSQRDTSMTTRAAIMWTRQGLVREEEKPKSELGTSWGWDEYGLLSNYLFPLSPLQLALGAALVNVQIPLLLGQLVEIVAKYMRDRVGNFMSESHRLSTQLLLLYGVQVWRLGGSGAHGSFPGASLNARPLLQGLMTFGYLVLLSHIGERMAMDMRKALFSSLLRYCQL